MDGAITRSKAICRWLGYRTYFRLVAFNYDHRLWTRQNSTPAGTIRSYELLNRHGSDPMLEAIDQHAGPAACIYDVGANIGMYAAALAAGAPERQVVAIEPAPRTVEQLRATLACNDLSDRVSVYHCGLGRVEESTQFFVSTYPELSGFDRDSATRWEATVAETVTVRMRRLDDLSEPAPDVIKLDVEGGGPAVLAGGRETLETHRPAVFVEVHEDALAGNPAGEMRTQFDTMNYEIAERDGYWVCLPGEDA